MTVSGATLLYERHKCSVFLFCIFIFMTETFYNSFYKISIPQLANVEISGATFGKINMSLSCLNVVIALLLFLALLPERRKFHFCLSIVLLGISSASFGILLKMNLYPKALVAVIMIVRTIALCGVSLLWTSAIPLLVSMFPGKTGLICALSGCTATLGYVSGYQFVKIMDESDEKDELSYITMSFTYLGFILCFILMPLSLFILRQKTCFKSSVEIEKNSLSKVVAFATHSGVACLALSTIFISVSRIQFHEYVATKLQYLDIAELSRTSREIFWFLQIVQIIASILSGILSDRGYASIIFSTGSSLAILGYFIMAIPAQIIRLDNIYFVCLLAAVVTFGVSISYTPIFLIVYQVALKQDLADVEMAKEYSIVTILFTANFGALIGKQLIYDFILPMFGFRGTCALLASLLFLATYLSTQYLAKIGLMRNVNKYEEGLTIAIKGLEAEKNLAIMNHLLIQTSGYESIESCT